MQETDCVKFIGVHGSLSGVDGVGTDQRNPSPAAGHDRRVLEVGPIEGELYQIAQLQMVQIGEQGRHSPALFPHQIAVERLNGRPGGRFVVGIPVVPSKGFGEIHRRTAGLKDLRDKIGAVAAQGLVIKIGRVSVQCSSEGISDCFGALINHI